MAVATKEFQFFKIRHNGWQQGRSSVFYSLKRASRESLRKHTTMKSSIQAPQQSMLLLLSLYLSSTIAFSVQSFLPSRPLTLMLMKDKDRRDALRGVSPPPTTQDKNARKQYQRKRQKPVTEQQSDLLRQKRQAEYNQMRANASGHPSIWSFESLFPDPVLDEVSIEQDLFGVSKREKNNLLKTSTQKANVTRGIGKVRTISRPGMMRIPTKIPEFGTQVPYSPPIEQQPLVEVEQPLDSVSTLGNNSSTTEELSIQILTNMGEPVALLVNSTATNSTPMQVDFQMTRMVQDKIYGYRRTQGGEFLYETSLMGDGAVQFRDGVRLGNPLKVNTDRLTYLAKKEMAHGRIEEAQELYEQAFRIDPRDGRAYLGLSKCAERRRDFNLARQFLRSGLSNSVSTDYNGSPDRGANPFLLQALGCLEEKMGHVSEAEALYIAAARSRPSHAAAWVSLGQLRTRILRQGAAAGRACYQSADRELKKAGLPPSSHVYTAWAALEHKKGGDMRKARELFQAALNVDPKCSAAWLQLGVMMADKEEWEKAAKCFEAVLKFDKRNSRVLQCYAIMETKRPDGNSRKAIELFERALKANSRDAGVLQAYALYVADLGDVDAARNLYVQFILCMQLQSFYSFHSLFLMFSSFLHADYELPRVLTSGMLLHGKPGEYLRQDLERQKRHETSSNKAFGIVLSLLAANLVATRVPVFGKRGVFLKLGRATTWRQEGASVVLWTLITEMLPLPQLGL